jgi:hypothetical protein
LARARGQGEQTTGTVESEHICKPGSYLGAARGENLAPPGQRLRLNHWALAGEWTIGPENVALDQAGGSIASASTRAMRTSRSRLERERRSPSACSSTASLRGLSRSVDVDEDGNGLLRDGRLHQLVR